ncbi:TadE-like protein [compost metagenome]
MRGVYVVEFAIIGALLFTLLLGVLDIGRLFFTVGALNEVVRRGARLAAVCQISDQDVLRRAIFNEAGEFGDGESRLIHSLEAADLSLTYLKDSGVPADPITEFATVRFVQISISNFTFTTFITPLVRLLSSGSEFSGFTLPEFRAILPRESLGFDGESEEPTPC